MWADQALERFMAETGIRTVLDIGSGSGEHAKLMRSDGIRVTTLSLREPADVVIDFMKWEDLHHYDGIWASHVLEHQPNVGEFLKKCQRYLREGGLLAVTVPPLKHEIVGGHLTLWNAGLLVYNLVLAGFDCSKARVGEYGYNISVLVRNYPRGEEELAFDAGDVTKLAKYFPWPISEGFDGRERTIRW